MLFNLIKKMKHIYVMPFLEECQYAITNFGLGILKNVHEFLLIS
jgi:hypothetical protein